VLHQGFLFIDGQPPYELFPHQPFHDAMDIALDTPLSLRLLNLQTEPLEQSLELDHSET